LTIKQLQGELRRDAVARDWLPHHTVGNLLLALTSEVGELCHLYRWKVPPDIAEAGAEAADVAIFLLRFCDVAGIDLDQAIADKMAENARRQHDGSTLAH